MEKTSPFGHIAIPPLGGVDRAPQFLEEASGCLKSIQKVIYNIRDGSHIHWANNKCDKLKELKSRLKEFKAQATTHEVKANELIDRVKQATKRTKDFYDTQTSFIVQTVNKIHFERIESFDRRREEAFQLRPEDVSGVLDQFKEDHAMLMKMVSFMIETFRKEIETIEMQITEAQDSSEMGRLQARSTEYLRAIREAEDYLRRSKNIKFSELRKNEGRVRRSGIIQGTEALVAHFTKTGESEVVSCLEETPDIEDQVNTLASFLETKLLMETDHQEPMDVFQAWPTVCTTQDRKEKVQELLKKSKKFKKLGRDFSDLIYQYLFNFFDPTGELRYDHICLSFKQEIDWCVQIGELQYTLQKFGRGTKDVSDRAKVHLATLRKKPPARPMLSSSVDLFNSIRQMPDLLKKLPEDRRKQLKQSVTNLVEVLKFKSVQFILNLNFKEFAGKDNESSRSMANFGLFFGQVFPDWVFVEIEKGKDSQEQKNVMFFFVLCALQLFHEGEQSFGVAIFNILVQNKKKFTEAFEAVASSKAYRDLSAQFVIYNKYNTLKKGIDKLKKEGPLLPIPFLPIYRQSFSLTSDQLGTLALQMRIKLETGLTPEQLEALYKKIHAHGSNPQTTVEPVKWGEVHLLDSWSDFFRSLAELNVEEQWVISLKESRKEWVRTHCVLMQLHDDFLTQCLALRTYYQDVAQESLPLDLLSRLSEMEKITHYKWNLKKILLEDWDSIKFFTGEGRLTTPKYSKNMDLFSKFVKNLNSSIRALLISLYHKGLSSLVATATDDKDNIYDVSLCDLFVINVGRNVDAIRRALIPSDDIAEKQWVDEFERICTLIFLTSELQERGYLDSPLARSLLESEDTPIEEILKYELQAALESPDV